ncbi:MAG: CotH kinase family protein, partial [Bacteroidetes bacterium]|nr:CotH kinase family protein [Bacteroidota bacterium]
MIRPRYLILFFFFAISFSLAGQEDFYDPGTIREIRIHFGEPGWRAILDSLFHAAGDSGKLIGDVTIDGHTCRNAGIRYKGYSSYNADEIKNPFNIDLDYTIKNQNHLGHVKLKLSNVIQDPSFVREVISYEIARKYLPASRANFANLYVNDTLIGLYTNVEAVDANFTQEHWGSHTNSFFKGEPLTLQYPFGQNANLALTHGADSGGYIPYYNMQSIAGWNDLYDLIYQLDRGADSAESILNIDRALWMHAFNEVLLNLDSYIGYSQNYYLYRDDNGRFNPILWDMNMSFGSFRESDGSTHFLGLVIPKLKVLDPLALMSFAISPRPLMTKLFSNDTLRKIYLAHMRTILNENIRNNWYFTRAQELQNQIDAAVLNDTNRFYSYDDFHSNLTVTVGGTGTMKEYPGLKDLMESRMAYLDNLDGFSGQPSISEISHYPDVPLTNNPCWITARIRGASMAFLGYRLTSRDIFSRIAMADDGNHHDGVAGDGIFGAMLTAAGRTIQYYVYAENDSAGILSPERAEYEFYTIQPEILPGDVVLNEFHAGSGQESWIEFFNNTAETLQLMGMQLSDDITFPGKWIFPDTTIPAKNYLLIYPAINSFPGARSALVSLDESGGYIQLSNSAGMLLDSARYGPQVPEKSTGRYPNGYGSMA